MGMLWEMHDGKYKDNKKWRVERNHKFLLSGEKCEICKINIGKVVIHHKDFSTSNHNQENLAALCHSCHRKIHDKENTRIRKKETRIQKDKELLEYFKKYSLQDGQLTAEM